MWFPNLPSFYSFRLKPCSVKFEEFMIIVINMLQIKHLILAQGRRGAENAFKKGEKKIGFLK